MVAHARALGHYVASRSSRAADRTGDDRFLDPRVVMAEYGAPHLVRNADLTVPRS
jgi:hypothetical protein